jgi:nitrous oxidase accessory protein NosD
VPKDFPTSQEAVDAAVPGDTITVSAGIYRENVTITTSGILLKGPKATIDAAYTGSCLDVQADDVTISGFTLFNGGLSAAPADGTEGGGLSYTGSGASIRDCDVGGCEDFGIKLLGHGEIKDCLVAACLGPGIIVDTDDQAGESVLLKGNEVYRNASGIEADDGPFVFDHNIVGANSGDGIHLTFLAAAADGTANALTVLTKNHSNGNGGIGMHVEDEVGAVSLIEKNELDANLVGLDLIGMDVAVNSNSIEQNRAGGILLKTTGATVDGNKVRRNTLVGILVAAPESVTDGLNTLTDNKVETSGGDGMHVTSNGNIITDNLFKDNRGDGLQVVAAVTGTQILDNAARDNAHDGIDNWGTETLISGNNSKDNVGADLAGLGDGNGTVDAASADNVVSDESGLEAVQELELDTLTPPAT